MRKTSIATEVMATSGQRLQLVRMISDAGAKGLGNAINNAEFDALTKTGAQLVLERGGELAAAVRQAVELAILWKVCEITGRSIWAGQVAEWQEFYRGYFDIECDFSSLKIPAPRIGFSRLIIIAAGLTANDVYQVCRELFGPCRKYAGDLHATLPTNDRTPANGAYAFWVRNGVEADQEWRNTSADLLKERGIQSETLLERLIHELKYFSETGNYLDACSVTLCAGSRLSGGGVPHSGRQSEGRLNVLFCHHKYADGVLGCREVVC